MVKADSIPSVLITGCGKGGIGHALALEFKSRGFLVIATLLDHEERSHLEEKQIYCFTADVTSEEDTVKLVESVMSVTGDTLNFLVNNAGLCYTMTATDTDVSEVEKMFAVNLFGPIRMVRHFHPLLIKGKGTIVNIGSVGGIVPYVYGCMARPQFSNELQSTQNQLTNPGCLASYNASKAALHHWGNTLRVELKPLGVKVVNIISGEVSTNILKRDQASSRELPETSFYLPLRTEFSKHINRVPNTTTPAEYAGRVVAEVTKSRPRAWFWTGSRSTEVWFYDMVFPRTYWASIRMQIDRYGASANDWPWLEFTG